MWGDKDTYVSREQQDRLMAALSSARLRVYEGAGHGLDWEDPAQIADDLAAFVAAMPELPRMASVAPR